MQQRDEKRPFDETGWYYGGVGVVILGITYGVVALITRFVHSADNNNDEKAKVEIQRLDACDNIDDEALRILCITGKTK